MAKNTPTLKEKSIVFVQEDGRIVIEDITKTRDHRAFLEILNTYKSFRFVAKDGTSCTVIKEMRPQFGDKENLKPIWYAHKRLAGKLKRKYIGKPENLTYKKLKEVAFALSQRELI